VSLESAQRSELTEREIGRRPPCSHAAAQPTDRVAQGTGEAGFDSGRGA